MKESEDKKISDAAIETHSIIKQDDIIAQPANDYESTLDDIDNKYGSGHCMMSDIEEMAIGNTYLPMARLSVFCKASSMESADIRVPSLMVTVFLTNWMHSSGNSL